MSRSGDGPLWRVLGMLENIKKSGTGYVASCPGPHHKHNDKHASLSVGLGRDGRVLLNCKTGCETSQILDALQLSYTDLFERSSTGNPIRRFNLPNGVTHVREDSPTGKIIRWERNGKNGLAGLRTEDLPLYRIDCLDTLPDPVIVCEGEPATEALAGLGVAAVGTVTGAAGTPSEQVLAALHSHTVWLWPDNDDVGREHMRRIAARLPMPPRWIDWKDAPEHGDAADYIASGGTVEGIRTLVRVEPSSNGHRDPSGLRLSIVRMSEVQPEPIEWLWRGRFARGKATLLMGDPGLGKSLISHWLAATVSQGGEWPDSGTCERGTAILFTIEDGLSDTVAPRLLAAHADMQHVIAVRGVVEGDDLSERMFALTQHLMLLEELIIENKATVVVLDPVTAYLGPDVNSHKEADVRAVLGPLQLLAERTRIVLVMLMHLNKGTGVSALYRATGSIAFPAVARVVLGVAPDPNDDEGKRRLLLPVKMNIGKLPEGIGYHIETAPSNAVLRSAIAEDQPPVLVWDQDAVGVDATSAMDRNGSVQELGAVAETKQALLQILANGRVPANECKRQLRESVGVTSETSLSRARKELGVRVRKEGFGGNSMWFWELAEPLDKRLARARANDTNESMQSMPSMPTPLIPKTLIDAKESLVLTRAREDAPHVVCRRCGRGQASHVGEDQCQWLPLEDLPW